MQAVIIVVDGQGPHDGTLVCTVVPQVTTVLVSYWDPFVYPYEEAGGLSLPTSPTANVASAALYGLDQALAYGQGPTHNVVTDSIANILSELGTQQLSLPYDLTFTFLLVSSNWWFTGEITDLESCVAGGVHHRSH